MLLSRSGRLRRTRGARRAPRGLALVPVPALVVALMLGGCGGHTATKAGVIARGNAICASAQSSIRAIAPPSGASSADLSTYLRRVRPILDRKASAFAALPRPMAQRATLEHLVDAVQAVDRNYRAAANAAAQGNSTGVAAALAALRASPVAALAHRYGMNACTGTAATVR